MTAPGSEIVIIAVQIAVNIVKFARNYLEIEPDSAKLIATIAEVVVDKVEMLAVRLTTVAAAATVHIAHSIRRRALGSAIEAGESTAVAEAAAECRAVFESS